ncbi:uncharacterized protein LOC103497259 isoform X1 [Cucumis melo]|uniref:Uncharacterized protein LOC103497259 isoform X1 n=1 Tax=Cucumis melo TaxID=3656 RepID=A0ABM3L4Z1_CUCME|nr:uncharacterized protein LOC103497259 isoform X1 [Cucumis melo]XP_050945097.1 uncharacterized protein LOC103497259 isoform X1 [Cucumis melo]XP_050945098.1 uncharacterized protein LOC103497259 isoform X1 [Cucumis melo]
MILRKKGEEWEELLAVTEPMLRKGHGLLKKMRNTSLILKNMEPVVIGLLCLKKLEFRLYYRWFKSSISFLLRCYYAMSLQWRCAQLKALVSIHSLEVVEGPCDSVIIPDGAPLSAYQYFENTHTTNTRKPAFRWLEVRGKVKNESTLLPESRKRAFGTQFGPLYSNNSS